MGIFTKLSTVIKSNINDLISRAENPEKMLNQIILDMRDQLAKAKREVAAAIADERKLKSQLDAEVKQARDWQHRAMLAVKEDSQPPVFKVRVKLSISSDISTVSPACGRSDWYREEKEKVNLSSGAPQSAEIT